MFNFGIVKNPLKIGVIGAGHLGKIHIRLIQEIAYLELVGFYDIDISVRNAVAEKFNIEAFDDVKKLIAECDVIDIVTPTMSHFQYAREALKMSKHIFIEKPITNTLKEAKELLMLQKEAHVKGMVGHVERFNPALIAVQKIGIDISPMFIEAHRLAPFNPRGTDVSVVLDLMIHDIDIILSVVKSTVKKISASGVAVVSKTPDIANARIEFDNGCVANLTASRISIKQMRKIRFFQKDTYISIDMMEKDAEIFRLLHEAPENESEAFAIEAGAEGETKWVRYLKPEISEINSIKLELELFAQSIFNETEPKVTLEDGYNALNVAYQVLQKIERNFLEHRI